MAHHPHADKHHPTRLGVQGWRGRRVRRAIPAAHNQHSWPASRRLTMFFVLAFLISWLLWPLTFLIPGSSPLFPVGPALAAVLVAVVSGGNGALLRLLRQLGRWRVPVRWYVLSLGLPCLLVVASAALTVAGGAPAPDLGPNPGWFMLIGTFASTLVIVGLFQELGWRGYALPLLQRNHTALGAALLLGIAWALWHLPELVSDTTGRRPSVPFLLMVIAQSVLLAWVYNGTGGAGRASAEDPSTGTGSVPLCMLFHASFNTCGALIFPALAGPHYLTLWWTLALLHVLAALVVIAYAGPYRLVRTLDTRALHGIT
ncbi:type II CAAX prenyl endopeptidase Rce1 family protein [Arthrobacter sp. NPDC093139]|uniref:CPBP family glutamic-type intramembrane protease n=1 Tax=Arthrobacter sp. NPDC093139 TaxID=3363945 RepID=UPI003804AA3F